MPGWSAIRKFEDFNDLNECIIAKALTDYGTRATWTFSDRWMSGTGVRSNFNFPTCGAMDQFAEGHRLGLTGSANAPRQMRDQHATIIHC